MKETTGPNHGDPSDLQSGRSRLVSAWPQKEPGQPVIDLAESAGWSLPPVLPSRLTYGSMRISSEAVRRAGEDVIRASARKEGRGGATLAFFNLVAARTLG